MTTDPTVDGERTPDLPEPSGADLPRIALQAARANAKKNGATAAKARRPRRRTTARDTGREPQGFGAVLQALLGERAWELPAAGGNLLDAWPDIAAAAAPRLADHVQAHAYDAETGRLDLRADSPAYATQARLMTRQLIAAANRHARREAVRTIRVLAWKTAPSPVTGGRPTESDAAAAATTEPPEPVRTRENACAGYRQALAAHEAAKTAQPQVNRAVAEARQRQDRALDAYRRAAFAAEEEMLREAEPAGPRGVEADVSRAGALRRLAAERAGRAGPTTSRLGRTA